MVGPGEAKPAKCLITGAAGFVGQALAAALLSEDSFSEIILTDVVEPPRPRVDGSNKPVESVRADLTDITAIQSLFDSDIKHHFLLHGIMSGQAESDFELGMKVNLDSSRLILDHLRATNPGAIVVYTSSTAVYGPPSEPGSAINENVAPDPRSSYGAQKHIVETLVNDYSRRQFLDGRVVRLPTVTVRPGKPTGAASSFASGIFREPLNGEKAILPVPEHFDLWVGSPRTVVKNLIVASKISASDFGVKSRIINLPGLQISISHMLEALETIGGSKARSLVEHRIDESTQTIVAGWPTKLETSKADALGFVRDESFHKILKEYIEDYVEKK